MRPNLSYDEMFPYFSIALNLINTYQYLSVAYIKYINYIIYIQN